MPVVHLVHGFVASGKTTFARQLARRENAFLLSIDEWYLDLFVDEPTHHIDLAAWERLKRRLETLWIDLVRHDASVILDWGFWRRADRDNARAMAREVRPDVRLYEVVCSEDVARRRCLDRSGQRGTFIIDGSGFDEMRQRFEPLADDEQRVTIVTS